MKRLTDLKRFRQWIKGWKKWCQTSIAIGKTDVFLILGVVGVSLLGTTIGRLPLVGAVACVLVFILILIAGAVVMGIAVGIEFPLRVFLSHPHDLIRVAV
jgi:hypothetical protein